MVHVQDQAQVFLKSIASKPLVLAPLYKTQCKITQLQQLTCTILLMKQEQCSQCFHTVVLSVGVMILGTLTWINNALCHLHLLGLLPSKFLTWPLIREWLCWNDHRLLGAPVRQTLIKGWAQLWPAWSASPNLPKLLCWHESLNSQLHGLLSSPVKWRHHRLLAATSLLDTTEICLSVNTLTFPTHASSSPPQKPQGRYV